MIKDYKKIPLRDVPVGTEFGTLITPNGTHWASFKLINKCGAFVTLRVFDERDETYSTEDAFITVPLTEDEKRAKYDKAAKELIAAMKNKIPFDSKDIGYHEMWNGWLDCDPWDMAAECEDQKIKVVGYCELGDYSKEITLNRELDIGVVAEDEFGNRFWCHAFSDWFTGEEWQI